MGDFIYVPNIPNAQNQVASDVPNMQINTNSIENWTAVDHIGYNTSNGQGGYHNVIRVVPQGSDPSTISGIGQVYTKTVSSDQELFYKSGGGAVTQLTISGVTPSPMPTGYSILPGGIIIQWGVNTVGSGTTVVSFPISFPNNAFNLQISPTQEPATYTALSTDFGLSSFKITTSGMKFYWIVIGN